MTDIPSVGKAASSAETEVPPAEVGASPDILLPAVLAHELRSPLGRCRALRL